MKRIESKIRRDILRVQFIQHNDGSFYGVLHGGAPGNSVWLWNCDHKHRSRQTAVACVRAEGRRFFA